MRLNKVVKILITSDIFLNSGWGFLAPVFAIFILRGIQGGDAKVVGFSAMVYWLVKSILQIPIGKYLDKNHGEKDDFYFLLTGTILAGFVPFGYLISFLPWHIYLCQVLYGIAMAMVIPSWYAIFTRHIDKGKEAFEWGLESTSIGLSLGVAGALGGLLVALVSFKVVFVLVGSFTFLAVILLSLIRSEMGLRDKILPRVFPFKL
ncbi:MAG: MFS transporter [Patescibacteria group bacterium]|nr:MFS transporter [Patescibacteria group bacterium]